MGQRGTETRTEETIRQHFTWKGLKVEVKRQCSTCHVCQVTKKVHKNYGKLPAKQPEVTPWEFLCVDMIGPYKIDRNTKKGTKNKTLELWCVTMIDPATGWFEIKQVAIFSAQPLLVVYFQNMVGKH